MFIMKIQLNFMTVIPNLSKNVHNLSRVGTVLDNGKITVFLDRNKARTSEFIKKYPIYVQFFNVWKLLSLNSIRVNLIKNIISKLM